MVIEPDGTFSVIKDIPLHARHYPIFLSQAVHTGPINKEIGSAGLKLTRHVMTLDDVFGSTGQMTELQECARAILIFFYGLALVRIAGRRVFGKWTALDIIVSIIVGSNLSRALTGGAPLWGTLAATTLLMALHWILAHAAAQSPRLSQLLEGRSIRLGENGRTDERALTRHAVSEADLYEALRTAGLNDVSDAKGVMLEPSGKIAVLKRS